ncbi:hypothetical protein [Methylovorus glucosotrophus]|uniref:Uncharacterized protein n=1 Tax=Methylovorus glucosotrophus (strain SIP3-4) TaxID=582744 RepID=C6XEM1_METGS|nr:hypothetical protein [Methylovorus glucosotrophus]ACT52078.1 hypothetical protein Msip34_2854 [Methylovorus glucosotrophus SIP3-4]
MNESIEQRVMHKVGRNEIQSAREALLLKLLSPDTDVKIRQRQFIKELMAEIKALRELGIGFDEIAETLREFGCKLSGETLRTYYYEEKRDENEEALAEVVNRYRSAAETAAEAFELTVGRDLNTLVQQALEGATARRKAPSPPVLQVTETEPTAASGAESARRVPEGPEVKVERGRIQELLEKHVGEAKTQHTTAAPPTPTAKDVNSLMNSNIDLTAIPDRAKPE